MSNYPLFQEILYRNPADVFLHFSSQIWSIFLDSADSDQQMEDTNRYSYIAFDPFNKIVIKDKKLQGSNNKINNPFRHLKKILSNYKLDIKPGLPPFQGGAIGYFSYDLCRYLEEINPPIEHSSNPYPDLAIGLYDIIIAFDHVLKKAWIISTGFPETNEALRMKAAQNRLGTCLEKISENIQDLKQQSAEIQNIDLKSPFDKNSYSNIVKQAQNYILEGDIFEVNLSHRFIEKIDPKAIDKYQLYRRMRESNPSPFSAYLNFDDYQILSSSPERFLLLNNKKVSTRPIKGTSARGKTPEEDRFISATLVSNEKDRSENIMIVDLMRNDLSKVCLPESIHVKKLCGLETYPSVHHLVSVIEGELKENMTAINLIEACFPGGSITGAPKIRAMQIIYELEPTARGPYCGSIGFIGFNGMMDTSIVIRTLLLHDDQLSYQAGGAVIFDSCPEGEYYETLIKSVAIKNTLTNWS